VTPARLAVLEILLGSVAALTHHEIEDSIEERGLDVDRVTLYRVLDWLVEHDLAHRIATTNRVWRFNAADRLHNGEHPHFHCTQCGRIICLDGPDSASDLALPPGYRPERMEINVHGLCAVCSN
jgi:Fur family ferric uptake transcriptional regulator